ncbi:MAG TPA: DUF6265 family protein [Flavobacteriales bacterium]
MQVHPLPALILLITWAGCGGPAAPPPVDTVPEPLVQERVDPWGPYADLVGDHIDRTTSDKYVTHENWRRESDEVLVGKGFALKGRDTVFVEDLKLERSADHVVYSARIRSENNGEWVPFTAQPHGPDSLVFENPGHDFPQCITYVQDTTDLSWTVRVSGMENGKERSDRYRFTPVDAVK